jgi:hypothetical protein
MTSTGNDAMILTGNEGTNRGAVLTFLLLLVVVVVVVLLLLLLLVVVAVVAC